ncbi:hypothetical protein [Sulfurisoma sediminicola]|uniref:Uncharacterized protein n=1 Tax=Sulfurisoma sediminicola TaxID=1381557 RepID=A0A497XBE7_9PROT|nr:hypothetical protein [Sulfurisoma sediminicola]RLJ63703.1 hypothetical protein DFR35_2335 [Sulfurisoma sediminicola]
MLPAFSFTRRLLPVVGSDGGFPVRRIVCVGRIAGLDGLQASIV